MTRAHCLRGLIHLHAVEPGAAVAVVIDVNGRFRSLRFFGRGQVRDLDAEHFASSAVALAEWVRAGLGLGITGPGGDA